MELDLKSSRSTVARKHLIKRTEEAIKSFLRDDCATNLKLIGALEEISFRLFAESNDVFLDEALNDPDDNEFHWDDEWMFTSFPLRTGDDSGLPDENEWLIESIRESKPSLRNPAKTQDRYVLDNFERKCHREDKITSYPELDKECSMETSDADYYEKRSPLMTPLSVSPVALVMTSSATKSTCHKHAGMEFTLESDEIWMLETCDQENEDKWFFLATPSTTKSTCEGKLHEYCWMFTGFKSDKFRMPETCGPDHVKKRPFLVVPSTSKIKKKGIVSTGRGKCQMDRRAMSRQEASRTGSLGKREEKSRENNHKPVVRRLFANEYDGEYHSGSNIPEHVMLQGDINIAPTGHGDKDANSYQSEKEGGYSGPFHHDEKKNRTLSARHRSAKTNENVMELVNGDKSITRDRFYVMDTRPIIGHKESKEGPGDDQNWFVISIEETKISIYSRDIELSDDYWTLISYNEDNSTTQEDILYCYDENDKISLCHVDTADVSDRLKCKTNNSNNDKHCVVSHHINSINYHKEDPPGSPISTFGSCNVSVTNSSYNSFGKRIAAPFTDRHTSSTQMQRPEQTKVISQSTKIESGLRSRQLSSSFQYQSAQDDWIIITVQEVEKLEASLNKR